MADWATKMPSKIIVARHGLRLDSINKQWLYTSPTPYDSPLAAPKGFQDASDCGQRILRELGKPPTHIYIHSSPFLRCVQTANEIAKVLGTVSEVTIRLDAVFGEWLTEDYYNDISPPPSDGHQSLSESSLAWLRGVHNSIRSMSVGTYQQSFQAGAGQQQRPNISIDSKWDIHKLGSSGDYGEEWSMMHERVCTGLRDLLDYYETVQGDFMVAVITHGAVCNSLLGFLSDQPLLQKVELSAFAIAEREPGTEDDTKGNSWRITFNSNKGTSSVSSHLPRLQRTGSNVAFPPVVSSYRDSSPAATPFMGSPILGGLTPPRTVHTNSNSSNSLIPQGRTPPTLSPTNSFKSIKSLNSDPPSTKQLAQGGQQSLPFALSPAAKQGYETSAYTTPAPASSASAAVPTDHLTAPNAGSNNSSAAASPSFRFVSNFGRSQASPLSLSPSSSPPKEGISLQSALSNSNNSFSKAKATEATSAGSFMLNFGS